MGFQTKALPAQWVPRQSLETGALSCKCMLVDLPPVPLMVIVHFALKPRAMIEKPDATS